MIRVSKEKTRRLLDIHGWSGVLLGLALYVVVFTGAVVVLIHEIGEWSVSGHSSVNVFDEEIDTTLETLAADVDPQYHEDVSLWQGTSGQLIVFFHKHTKNDEGKFAEKGVRFILDPETMTVVNREEGFQDDLPEIASGFLERFFLDLHIRLHAPNPIGLYLTGLLGLILLISAISGFILHRHLIKDIFLSPRLSSRLLNTRDRHNLAGTWGIIFSILLAFTGAFFSFASTIGLPVIAITAFGGDQQKAIETVIGVPEKEDPTPAKFVGLDTILKQVKQENIAGSQPFFVVITHLGRADAQVLTTHDTNEDTMFFKQYQFSGTSGEFLGEKTRLGTEPSLSNTLNALMGVLHFGWFAGLLSKIIWVLLGLSVCYVTLTGLQLWVQRREQSSLWQFLSRFISIIGYGTPLAMSTATIGFLISYANYPEQVTEWTINGFFIGTLASFAIGLLIKRAQLNVSFQYVLGLIVLSLPLVRIVSSEQSLLESFTQGHANVVGMDLLLMLTGVLILLVSTGVFQQQLRAKSKPQKIEEVEIA